MLVELVLEGRLDLNVGVLLPAAERCIRALSNDDFYEIVEFSVLLSAVPVHHNLRDKL